MAEGRCTLVEIKQAIPGFNRFIGSWVYEGDVTFIVDVGPRNTAHILKDRLSRMGIRHIDFVLLTHIHIDHGGALNSILTAFPMARAVCHTKGTKHLIDPVRLWEGSRQVLREKAEAFGQPEAVDPERLIHHGDVEMRDLIVIETPGHAPHHISYSYNGILFSGEAAGNYYNIRGSEFLRPATPPRFFLETFLKSVEKLLALQDQRICYGHFGEAASSQNMLNRFRSQLQRWEQIIEHEAKEETADLVPRCIAVLLRKDPELKAFTCMPLAVQKREQYFMANSVQGFLGYFKERRSC